MKFPALFLLLVLGLPLAGHSSKKFPTEANYVVRYDLPNYNWRDISVRTLAALGNEPGFAIVTELFDQHIPALGRFDPEGVPGEIRFSMNIRLYDEGMLVRVEGLRLIREGDSPYYLEQGRPEEFSESEWRLVLEEADRRMRALLAHLADAFLSSSDSQPSEVVMDYVKEMPQKPTKALPLETVRVQMLVKKPVIYLYPEEPTEVSVRVDFAGSLDFLYPKYDAEEGWRMRAHPNGQMQDLRDGSEHRYLFWEGNAHDRNWETEEGFCVRGAESVVFLQQVLPELGLQGQEIHDFITFWGPQLQQNEWNLIGFPQTLYSQRAKLNIFPAPDALIRVFMTFRPSDRFVEVPAPNFTPQRREGFVAVEWGGLELPRLSPLASR